MSPLDATALQSATRLRVLSPSQVGKFDCPREWAFAYLKKLEAPKNKYAEEGAECARRLENYYKTGVMPVSDVYGRVAMEAKKHLPPRAAGVHSEFALYEVDFGGGLFGSRREGREMRMDVYEPTRATGYRIGDDWSLDDPLICDLKTTTDLKNAKDALALKRDIQVALYCKGVMRETGATTVQCRWVYVTRAKDSQPRSKVVDFKMTAQEVADLEAVWQPTITQINRLYALQPEAETVPADTSKCWKFSGCAYWHTGLNVCPQTPYERMFALMSTAPNDTKADIDNFLLNSGFGAPPAVAQAPAAPSMPSWAAPGAPAAPAAPALPAPGAFALPVDQTTKAPIEERFRPHYLQWCFQNAKNPLAHLNVEPDAAWTDAARNLVVAAGLELVKEAAAALVAAPTPAAAPAAPAPAPVVATPPAPVAAVEPEPQKPRGPGRPKLSDEEKAAKAAAKTTAPAVTALQAVAGLGSPLQIVISAEAMEVLLDRLGLKGG